MVRSTPLIDEKTKTTEVIGLGIDVGRLKYDRLFRAPGRRRKQRHLRGEPVVSWEVLEGPRADRGRFSKVRDRIVGGLRRSESGSLEACEGPRADHGRPAKVRDRIMGGQRSSESGSWEACEVPSPNHRIPRGYLAAPLKCRRMRRRLGAPNRRWSARPRLSMKRREPPRS